MSKKVGILGGTFDPIHMGHLFLAENAYCQFELDTVLIMPTGNPPHKTDKVVTDKMHRNKMVQLAIEDNGHMKLSLFEQERSGYIYTADTLKLLCENNPGCEYYFIVGGDSLAYMDKWYKPEVIFAHTTILAAIRDDIGVETVKDIAEDLKRRFGAKIELLRIPEIGISSSLVRDRVAAGKSIKYYVPKDVEKYIYNNKLYKR